MQVLLDLLLSILFVYAIFMSKRREDYTLYKPITLLPFATVLFWSLLVTYTYVTRRQGTVFGLLAIWTALLFVISLILYNTFLAGKDLGTMSEAEMLEVLDDIYNNGYEHHMTTYREHLDRREAYEYSLQV